MNNKDIVVSLRLPRDLANEIRKSAVRNDRSVSAELRHAARRHVVDQPREEVSDRAS
jgi:hypothetical protein